ncbi:hypothetical protein [Adhaeribacter terreus]|uniref:Uncharacterized protein n=1 Tax=Adhaeribacter terreus TaxID=529703 RepID=A0ABW0EFF1_9BACT
MERPVKSLCYCILVASIQLVSCTAPTKKQAETVEKQELPAKTDSLKLQPKDGTDVESDSTFHQ